MVTMMQRSRCLFEPLNLGGLTLANRIAVSPMCQYSGEDGAANDWHLQDLGSLSLSGAALVIVEQTTVEPAGGISPWEGGGALAPDAGAWATVAPSAISFDDHWPAPQALDEAGLARIRDAHANAARRADRLGFDLVELLAADGFLLHSFLSPIANRRTDSYGGSLANGMRYPLEVAAATREAWPRRKPLGMRITGCDWVDGGITTDEAGIFASELCAIGWV